MASDLSTSEYRPHCRRKECVSAGLRDSAVCTATRTALITGATSNRLRLGLEEPLRDTRCRASSDTDVASLLKKSRLQHDLG